MSKERDNLLKKQWRERNPGYRRAWGLKALYGLTVEDYDKLLESQNGGCAICGLKTEPNGKSLCVDHNHETGQIRGILCFRCNTFVGQLEHPLRSAAEEYLSRFTE